MLVMILPKSSLFSWKLLSSTSTINNSPLV